MSSDGHYVSVMKGLLKIVVAGVFLTVSVCDAECMKHSFKKHIIDVLLIDHWFQMNIFTPPGEEVTVLHEFLAVINIICSSLRANTDPTKNNVDPINGSLRTKIVWIYEQMLKNLVKGRVCDKNPSVQCCDNYKCYKSYGTSFINTTQFENMYKKVCQWNGSIPGTMCPFPQDYLDTTAFTPVPEQNASRQPVIQDAQNPMFKGLVVSAVINIILMLLLFLLVMKICCYSSEPQGDSQARVDEENLALHRGNTGNINQDQNDSGRDKENEEHHK
ncbi:uncharacterized protein LOC132868988 isoform X3 [Neoarius graeffei]|uniref:uncharacterized protein LOC132868988 isoform X3 n=1 Tax=Neoarius graeffei TaxID=443677 RepID=UPI00298CA13C|nr:uncharacterized protein LOC132868988 isoform X3 [Neoarius graeffei]